MPADPGFTDSTDWLDTPLSTLAPLDAALRCQVCKDFFTTPMITSCSHTFCSLCIRRYLSQEGRCPACRESDQEIKLRRNWSVEEAVAQFREGREGLLKFARNTNTSEVPNGDGRPKKRRKVEHTGTLPERRSTRSQSRKTGSQAAQNGYIVPSSQEEVQDSDEDRSIYEEKPTSPPPQESDPHDGLVACPCCGRRMKEAIINTHLDKCMAGEATPSPRRSNTPQVPAPSIAYGQSKPLQSQERLPTINYSMLNDNALRRKLKELGIPNHGSKELMRKRHTEWINLWNANSDSLRPVTKLQLLRDLDRWEKTLGRQVDKAPSGVMVKDFDRDGWQKSNKNDFDDLIKQAREKRVAVLAAKVQAKEHNSDDVETEQSAQKESNGIATIFESASSRLTNGEVTVQEDKLTNGDHTSEASTCTKDNDEKMLNTNGNNVTAHGALDARR